MADNKTSFGDEITSDLTNSAKTLRRVTVIPRGVPNSSVDVEFDLTRGDYTVALNVLTLSRHRARDLCNALGGILTWADNESWPARDDYNMQLYRERMEIEELKAQGSKA